MVSEQRLRGECESGDEKPQVQPVARPSVRKVGVWAAVTGPCAGAAGSCPVQRGCLPYPRGWVAHTAPFQRHSLAASVRRFAEGGGPQPVSTAPGVSGDGEASAVLVWTPKRLRPWARCPGAASGGALGGWL